MIDDDDDDDDDRLYLIEAVSLWWLSFQVSHNTSFAQIDRLQATAFDKLLQSTEGMSQEKNIMHLSCLLPDRTGVFQLYGAWGVLFVGRQLIRLLAVSRT